MSLCIKGYRGGRNNWDSNNSRQGFNSGSGGNRWGNSRGGGGGGGGFSDSRGGSSGGGGGGFRGKCSIRKVN
jgi:hypothetical protein